MNRNTIHSIAIALAILLVSWLGGTSRISEDMMQTLLIVLPALWVVSIARYGNCCWAKRA